jgi:ATP-binding cassette, subfamily B, multidrug efflux pump
VLISLLRTRLRPYLWSLALLMGLQLVQIVAMLMLPALNASVVNNGVIRGDLHAVKSIGALMLVAAIVQVSASIGAVVVGSRTAMSMGRDVRSAVFRKVQRLSAQEIGQFGTPSLITRTVNDVQQVQTLAQTALSNVVSAPIVCIGAVVLALLQDVQMSYVLMASIPVLTVVTTVILARMSRMYSVMQTRIDLMNQQFREQITGVRVVRAFVRDDYERRRLGRTNADLFALASRVGRLISAMFPAIMLVVNLFSVALVWLGGHRVDVGTMNVGGLNAFLGYLMLMLVAFIMAMFMFLELPRANVCAQRIQEVLRTESSVVVAAHPVQTATSIGYVVLRKAEFRYPGAEEPVLRGIDLTARPGETVAIIGSTGSGKTTLLSLVLRLIDATGGEVLVNGVDVRDLAPEALRTAVGLVPQRPYLFSGTIASNLRYGRPEATDDELWHALDIVQARDFVEGMPEGLDAPITQGGSNLSGGQRQRLSIARTVLRRPHIYLFDDCFSALDYATDAALRAALATETSAATILIVAQRVATIRSADRIVVLDGGRVSACGPHSELMRTSETYREIALSQLTEQEAV